MKTIRISRFSIISLDGAFVDKCSLVNDEQLQSLLDCIAMFFTSLYQDTHYRYSYFISKHVDFLCSLVGKVDASEICTSLNLYLKSHHIDDLSSDTIKIVVL